MYGAIKERFIFPIRSVSFLIRKDRQKKYAGRHVPEKISDEHPRTRNSRHSALLRKIVADTVFFLFGKMLFVCFRSVLQLIYP